MGSSGGGLPSQKWERLSIFSKHGVEGEPSGNFQKTALSPGVLHGGMGLKSLALAQEELNF